MSRLLDKIFGHNRGVIVKGDVKKFLWPYFMAIIRPHLAGRSADLVFDYDSIPQFLVDDYIKNNYSISDHRRIRKMVVQATLPRRYWLTKRERERIAKFRRVRMKQRVRL